MFHKTADFQGGELSLEGVSLLPNAVGKGIKDTHGAFCRSPPRSCSHGTRLAALCPVSPFCSVSSSPLGLFVPKPSCSSPVLSVPVFRCGFSGGLNKATQEFSCLPPLQLLQQSFLFLSASGAFADEEAVIMVSSLQTLAPRCVSRVACKASLA